MVSSFLYYIVSCLLDCYIICLQTWFSTKLKFIALLHSVAVLEKFLKKICTPFLIFIVLEKLTQSHSLKAKKTFFEKTLLATDLVLRAMDHAWKYFANISALETFGSSCIDKIWSKQILLTNIIWGILNFGFKILSP